MGFVTQLWRDTYNGVRDLGNDIAPGSGTDIANVAAAVAIYFGAAELATMMGTEATVALFDAGASASTAITVGNAVEAVTMVAALSAGSSLMAGVMPAPSALSSAMAQGLLVNTSNNVAPIPVIYGTRKVGGARSFVHVSGANNEYLHLIIVAGEGEIDAFTNVYIDDVLITDAKFTGLVTSTQLTGTDAQAAMAGLITELPSLWTADHKGAGLAYVYLRLKFDPKAFSGFPVITMDVRGRKVYDPRDNMLTYSEQFDNAAWPKAACTVSANAVSSPWGTLDAEKLVSSTAATAHYVYQQPTLVSGTTYTLSVYAKAAERSTFGIWTSITGGAFPSNGSALFNLATGAVSGMLGVTATIQDVGGGWYLCSISRPATASAMATLGFTDFGTAVGYPTSSAGDGVSGVYIFGAQLNRGSLLPYTKTTTPAINPVTAWRDNPALCILDYLTNTRFGCSVPLSQIDEGSFVSAANYCDELVSTPSGNAKRYICSGVINVDSQTLDNLRQLESSCRSMLTFAGGKYKLIVDRPSTSVSPFPFSEDNITGQWTINTAGRRSRFNRVTGTFFNPANSWQPDYAISDSPAYRSPTDNGLLLEGTLDLPFTPDLFTAQRLAGLHLKQSRFSLNASFRAFQSALRCEVGDVVTITHSTPGWTAKLFRVVQIGLPYEEEVEVTCVEYDATAYTLDTLTAVTATPSLSLPNPFTMTTPSGFVLTSGTADLLTTGDGTVISRIKAVWTPPTNTFVTTAEIQFKLTTDSLWQSAPPTEAAQGLAYLTPVKDGLTYNVRIRFVNTLGVPSTWVSGANHPVVGKTAPPANVTGLTYLANEAGVQLSWATPSDRDYLDTTIKTGASWAAGTVIYTGAANTFLWSRPTGTAFNIWAKHRDTSLNESAAEALLAVTYAAVTIDNSLVTVGGRNILTKTATLASGGVAATDYYGKQDAFSATVAAGVNYRIQGWSMHDVGVYSLSFWVKSTVSTTLNIDLCDQAYASESVSAVWKFVKLEGVYLDSAFLNSVYFGFLDLNPVSACTLTVSNLMLEFSSKSSSWAPAPEDTQNANLTLGSIPGTLAAGQVAPGIISANAFVSGIEPVTVVSAVPGTKSTTTIVNSTDGKLYRWNGSSYVSTIPTTDLLGAVTSAQVASLASTKITGTLTDAQLAAISAAKVTGQIAGTQITDGAISTAKIAANAITAAHIAAGSISASKLLVGGIGDAINQDPFTKDVSAWVGGGVVVTDVTAPVGPYVLAMAGALDAFSLPVPLDELKNYLFRMSVRLVSGTTTAYLSVKFFDANGNNIVGSSSGAAGWPGLGTFFYFGLVNGVPAASWTEYAISFGPSETVKIPTGAKSVAVGILANYSGGFGVQYINNVVLSQKVDGSVVVDGSIAATKIAAGSITANQLAANSITVNKLLVAPSTGNNLWTDPGFGDTSAWLICNWGSFPTQGSVTDGVFGTTTLRGGVGGASARGARRIPVTIGKSYKVSMRARNVGGNGTIYLRLDGSNVSSGVYSQIAGSVENVAPTGVWVEYSWVWTATVAWVSPMVLMNYVGTAGYQEAQDIRIEERTGGDLIVDGAVTAAKIAANTITAGQIAAGAITATQLAAGTITGDKIAANTIVASNIDSRGLSIKDASGNVLFASGTPLTSANITPDPAWMNNATTGAVLHILRPGGAAAASNVANQQGSLKIRLPQSWTSTMMRFAVDVYEYGVAGVCTYEIGGYNYFSGPGSTWANNPFVRYYGPPAAVRPIYFGHDGTYCCIYLGVPAGYWQYPQVQIRDFVGGYSNNTEAMWGSGWAVTWEMAPGPQNVTASIHNPVSGGAMSGIDQIDSGNISTYITNAAIGSAQIGNAQINSAHIGTLDAGSINTGFLNAARIQVGTATALAASNSGEWIAYPAAGVSSVPQAPGVINFTGSGAPVTVIASISIIAECYSSAIAMFAFGVGLSFDFVEQFDTYIGYAAPVLDSFPTNHYLGSFNTVLVFRLTPPAGTHEYRISTMTSVAASNETGVSFTVGANTAAIKSKCFMVVTENKL